MFSRRLLSLGTGKFAAPMTAIRQVGVGSQGGAETLAIFHGAVRNSASSFVSKHAGAAGRKRRALFRGAIRSKTSAKNSQLRTWR